MNQQLNLNSGIYLITNTVNSKEYGGRTGRTLKERECEHWGLLKSGAHPNKHLQRAWDLYGESAFTFDIMEIVERKDGMTDTVFDDYLKERETVWVRCLDLKHPNGYNILDPGVGWLGVKREPFTLKHRTNMSIAAKGKPKPPRTEETKAKLSAAGMGHDVSLETRAKISASNTGNKHTEETKAKIGASGKGRKQSPETIEKRTTKLIGKKRTPEQCANISAGQKGKRWSDERLAAWKIARGYTTE